MTLTLRPEYAGAAIYATPGSGKTWLARRVRGVYDTDDLLAHLMAQRVPALARLPARDAIRQYWELGYGTDDVYEQVARAMGRLSSDGHAILTGSLRLMRWCNLALTGPRTAARRLGGGAADYLAREAQTAASLGIRLLALPGDLSETLATDA